MDNQSKLNSIKADLQKARNLMNKIEQREKEKRIERNKKFVEDAHYKMLANSDEYLCYTQYNMGDACDTNFVKMR
ncbi:TPA: hypothetical protein PMC50_002837 [Vibrio cholerae]|nr:hypothetical protein [Vibrio cholerae]